MTDREKLIAWIGEKQHYGIKHGAHPTHETSCSNAEIADHLLAHGVIVPPCEIGDVVYYLLDGVIRKARIEERVFNDSKHGYYSGGWRIHAYDRTNKFELSFDPLGAQTIEFINNQMVLIDIFFTKEKAELALMNRESDVCCGAPMEG